jgi:hypothetical protein
VALGTFSRDATEGVEARNRAVSRPRRETRGRSRRVSEGLSVAHYINGASSGARSAQ